MAAPQQVTDTIAHRHVAEDEPQSPPDVSPVSPVPPSQPALNRPPVHNPTSGPGELGLWHHLTEWAR
jgi:hypothetical protein